VANVCVNLYDGEFDIGFDCSGATRCKYALAEISPITDDDDCIFNQQACRHLAAQLEILEKLKRRITKSINELKETEDY
jgi:hypothetical protein